MHFVDEEVGIWELREENFMYLSPDYNVRILVGKESKVIFLELVDFSPSKCCAVYYDTRLEVNF